MTTMESPYICLVWVSPSYCDIKIKLPKFLKLPIPNIGFEVSPKLSTQGSNTKFINILLLVKIFLQHETSNLVTLNYWMMVERYPNLKKEVGGTIPDCEIFSLLDKKKLARWSTTSCALVLACRSSVSNKQTNKPTPPPQKKN